jgi:hypothetical protein
VSRINTPTIKWFTLPWLQTLAYWFGKPAVKPEKIQSAELLSESCSNETPEISKTYGLHMLATANTHQDRVMAIQVAMASSMPINEIERHLEQHDLQSK